MDNLLANRIQKIDFLSSHISIPELNISRNLNPLPMLDRIAVHAVSRSHFILPVKTYPENKLLKTMTIYAYSS